MMYGIWSASNVAQFNISLTFNHHVCSPNRRLDFVLIMGNGMCNVRRDARGPVLTETQIEDKFSPLAKDLLAKLVKFQTVKFKLDALAWWFLTYLDPTGGSCSRFARCACPAPR